MKWLKKNGSSWDLLAAQGTGAKSGGGNRNNYLGGQVGGGQGDNSCFGCGETDHYKRDCPKRGLRLGGGAANRREPTDRKPRDPPSHRKFHYALHKGEEGRWCLSHKCMPLKKLPFGERIKLLKENGDCGKCCGDCPPNKCKLSRPWVCGGEKDGQGCGKNHEGHELFCCEAKLCFSAISTTIIKKEVTLESAVDEEDSSLLQIMKIPRLKLSKYDPLYEVV